MLTLRFSAVPFSEQSPSSEVGHLDHPMADRDKGRERLAPKTGGGEEHGAALAYAQETPVGLAKLDLPKPTFLLSSFSLPILFTGFPGRTFLNELRTLEFCPSFCF